MIHIQKQLLPYACRFSEANPYLNYAVGGPTLNQYGNWLAHQFGQMLSPLKILRSREWKSWSRRKKIVAVVLLILIVIALTNPEMAVFAGVLDVSILDVLITFLGIQLLLYSDQIRAGIYLTGNAIARGYRALKSPGKR